MSKLKYGFEPIYNQESKILILGSFPSIKSRENNFYYGNKQNKFWRMLEYIFNEKIENEINDKTQFLLKHNIALWDIVKKSYIKTSNDSELVNLSKKDINNISLLLPPNTKIEKILCNGTKSFQLVKKFIKTSLPIICLPSTSPANFKFDLQKWKNELK